MKNLFIKNYYHLRFITFVFAHQREMQFVWYDEGLIKLIRSQYNFFFLLYWMPYPPHMVWDCSIGTTEPNPKGGGSSFIPWNLHELKVSTPSQILSGEVRYRWSRPNSNPLSHHPLISNSSLPWPSLFKTRQYRDLNKSFYIRSFSQQQIIIEFL